MERRTAQILEWAAIVVCGLVPLVGLVFFGWNMATVIFMLWLDAYLSSLRMIPANVHFVNNNPERAPLDPRIPLMDRIGIVGQGAFMWVFLALPVMIAGKLLDNLVRQFSRGGFEVEASDLVFDEPWWLAILVGGRLYQCVQDLAAARAIEPPGFAKTIKVLYAVLLCRGLVLFALAGFSTVLGFFSGTGAEIFVALSAVGLIAIEWYATRRDPS